MVGVLLNPSCYYIFGVAIFQLKSNLDTITKEKLLLKHPA